MNSSKPRLLPTPHVWWESLDVQSRKITKFIWFSSLIIVIICLKQVGDTLGNQQYNGFDWNLGTRNSTGEASFSQKIPCENNRKMDRNGRYIPHPNE